MLKEESEVSLIQHMEDFMQPSLFDEVAMIMNSEGLLNPVYLIKLAQEPLANSYTEKERPIVQPSVKLSPESVLVQLGSKLSPSQSDPKSPESTNPSLESDVTIKDNFLPFNNNIQNFNYLIGQSS